MWEQKDDKLKRTFTFKDFRAAFAFMMEVAEKVDEMDHHPSWSNMYNKVDIELSTHDAGDIVTDKDRALASAIDLIFEQEEYRS